MSANPNCILVIVDKFTKFAHFLALKHSFTTIVVAKVFLDNVYTLHGMPDSIVSDCGKIFTSHLWKELFSLARELLWMISAYHPQFDGQTERVSQCLETFLRSFYQCLSQIVAPLAVSCRVLVHY
jgi:hypothetical protein